MLALLEAAAEPLKAYDLMGRYDAEKLAKPPTIYRALHRLIEAGLAHRVLSLDAYAPCRMPGDAHTPGFLICEVCGSATEVIVEPELLDRLDPTGPPFRVTHAVVEAIGTCQACSRN